MSEKNREDIFYHEVQRLNRFICLASLLLPPFAAVNSALLIHKYFPPDKHPSGFFLTILMGILVGILTPLFIWSYSLSIRIRDDGLFVRFFPFHWSFRRISLEALQKFEKRTCRVISEFGGWGIRNCQGNSSMIFWGNQCIQFEYATGQKFMLGSKSPDKLVRAIERCLTSIDDSVFFLKLGYIQPSQMYISKSKLDSVMSRFDSSKPETLGIMLVRRIDDDIVLTDGHTRAYTAFKYGLDKIAVSWDRDKCDIREYKLAVDHVRKEGVRTISDCIVLPHERYEQRWYAFCKEIRKSIKTDTRKIAS
jgi:hypothetical protein